MKFLNLTFLLLFFSSAVFADEKAVLDGAKQILMERFAEDADLLEKIRNLMKNEAHIFSSLIEGKEKEGATR